MVSVPWARSNKPSPELMRQRGGHVISHYGHWLCYNDVIMGAMASQITGVSIVCSTVGSGLDRRNHQSSASLAFVQGIHRWPANSPHKRPVMQKMFPFRWCHHGIWVVNSTTLHSSRPVDMSTFLSVCFTSVRQYMGSASKLLYSTLNKS